MLHFAWGTHWKVSEQFPPNNEERALVMFDQSECTDRGTTDENGQQWKGACGGSQMFSSWVPKYKVLDYVRDDQLIRTEAPRFGRRLLAQPDDEMESFIMV